MRGARHETGRIPCAAGIIPAYAGSTPPPARPCAPWRDHPRVCGEHPDMLALLMHPMGIIPAYAGSTVNWPVRRYGNGDHPRVCGEHSWQQSTRRSPQGSSPRMRGAQDVARVVAGAPRIIPAYAGSTTTPALMPSKPGDHPRVCGEHMRDRFTDESDLGSSPRMRGALDGGRDIFRVRGIIPAYAGSTATSPIKSAASWDHPRVCGEHCGKQCRRPGEPGSSPRMRGALRRWRLRTLSPRIIPAYAGSTNT